MRTAVYTCCLAPTPLWGPVCQVQQLLADPTLSTLLCCCVAGSRIALAGLHLMHIYDTLAACSMLRLLPWLMHSGPHPHMHTGCMLGSDATQQLMQHSKRILCRPDAGQYHCTYVGVGCSGASPMPEVSTPDGAQLPGSLPELRVSPEEAALLQTEQLERAMYSGELLRSILKGGLSPDRCCCSSCPCTAATNSMQKMPG